MRILAATMSVLACLVAATAAVGAEPKDPAGKAAEKAARVRKLVKKFSGGFATVRFRLKTLSDGTKPNIASNYRCPGCGSSSAHVSSDFIEKNIPCMIEGFVVASNQVLVR